MNEEMCYAVLERTTAEIAASTDTGNVRTLNEDNLAVVHFVEPSKSSVSMGFRPIPNLMIRLGMLEELRDSSHYLSCFCPSVPFTQC
jgi:hypothetical protein